LANASWRWVFGINLPVTAAAILVTFFILRKHLLPAQPIAQLDETAETGRRATLKKRLMTIDVGGQFLFLFGFGLMILAFTWSGATYDWNSASVLAPLVIGAVLSCGFFYWEYLMAPGHALNRLWPWQKSMIPWQLLVHKDIGLLFYTCFATGMALYSVIFGLQRCYLQPAHT
jgi:MFS family permease